MKRFAIVALLAAVSLAQDGDDNASATTEPEAEEAVVADGEDDGG